MANIVGCTVELKQLAQDIFTKISQAYKYKPANTLIQAGEVYCENDLPRSYEIVRKHWRFITPLVEFAVSENSINPRIDVFFYTQERKVLDAVNNVLSTIPEEAIGKKLTLQEMLAQEIPRKRRHVPTRDTADAHWLASLSNYPQPVSV